MAEPVTVAFDCAEDKLRAAGMDCSEDRPCAVYLELSEVAMNGRNLYLAGDLHSTGATVESILLGSHDSGITWRDAAPRVAGGALDQLQFYDLQHGWAAGELQYPLPHDPFFLVSTDGGELWRRKPVISAGGRGSVQSFSFDTAQHGELIIDSGKTATSGRYALYESETGAESWMIRGTTGAMPKMKHPPVPSDAWRLKTDPDGKFWRLERDENGKWELTAEFPIEAARCPVVVRAAKDAQ